MTELQINYHDDVAELLLASPDKNNAMDQKLSDDMLNELEALAQDDDVRAVILGSTGGIFTAGGDLDMLHETATEAQDTTQHPALQAQLRNNTRVVEKLWDFPKPTIAAIEGPCIGAGIGWVAACDVRIASERSFFDTAYMNLGLGTDFGVSWLLGQSIGSARTLDWILRPRRVTAHEAQSSGLLGLVVPPENAVLDRAHEVATFLTRNGPELIASLRQSVRDAKLPLSDALDSEANRFIEHLPQARLPVRGG